MKKNVTGASRWKDGSAEEEKIWIFVIIMTYRLDFELIHTGVLTRVYETNTHTVHIKRMRQILKFQIDFLVEMFDSLFHPDGVFFRFFFSFCSD